MFARYSNIKAGKFQATEAEKMSDTYSEEEFENLNDVAKVLGAVGISIQEGNDFKGIQEVFDEIIAKWEDLNEVQRNGIATSLAGTRQREALYTALENSTRITDLMTISMNSLGTAEEKMAAYSDSVEASQKGVTAAFEEWVLKMNASPVLKWFNDQLAFTIENVDALAISLGAIFAASQWKQLVSLGGSGLEKLGEKFMNLGSMNFFSQGGEKVDIAQGLKNYAEELNLKFATNSIDELNKKFISLGKGMDDTTLSIVKQGQAALMNVASSKQLANSEKLRYWMNNDILTQQGREIYADEIIRELKFNSAQEEAAARKVLIQYLDKETKQRIVQNAQAPSATSRIASGILSLAGAGAGLYTGKSLGSSLFGDTGSVYGGMAGTILGGMIGAKLPGAITGLASIKAAGGISAAFTGAGGGAAGLAATAGPIGVAVAAAILGTGTLVSFIKQTQEQAKQEAIKEATETAAEIEEQYKSAISSTSDVQRYDELAKGVDTLGRNVSLIDDEYQEFLDTSNALAEVFPDLVVRTDEFGNKLLGTNDKVGTITDSVNELTLAMQRSYNASLINKDLMGSTLEETQKSIKESEEKIQEYKNNIKEAQSIALSPKDIKITDINDLMGNRLQDLSNSLYLEGQAAINIGDKNLANSIREKLLEKGIMEYNNRIGEFVDYIYVSIDDADEALEIVKDFFSTEVDTGEQEQLIAEEQRKINSQKKVMEPYYSALAQQEVGEEAWNAYSEEQQQALSSVIGTIDFFNKDGTEKSIEQYQNDIREMVFSVQQIIAENPLVFDIIYSNNDSKTLKEVKDARDNLLLTLLSMLSNGASIDEINGLLIPFGFEYQENGPIIDTQDYDRLLQERGLSENVAKQLGNVDIETLKYAYEEIDTEVLKTIKDIDELYDIINSDKVNQDNLDFFVSEIERLQNLGVDLFPDEKKDLTSNERYMKSLVKQVEKYRDALKASDENFEDLLDKAKQMSGTSLIGTNNLSVEDIQDQYQDYQDFINYFSGEEFNGETIDAEIYGKLMEYEDLLPYIMEKNVEGLLEELNSFIETGNQRVKDSFDGQIAESEKLTAIFLENNAEWVRDFQTKYRIDLTNFTTLNQSKDVINALGTGNIASAWEIWKNNMISIYGEDYTNFAGYQAKKSAMLGTIAGMYGRMTQEEWEAKTGIGKIYGWSQEQKDAAYEAYVTREPTFEEKVTAAVNSLKQQEAINKRLEEEGYLVSNVGGAASSGGGGGSSSTMEDILNARKALINKEYEAMLVYDESTGKATHTKYFEKMKEVLNDQLEYYNSLLKTAQTESERLDTLQKIQDVQVELANLNDEELQDELNLAQTKEASLSAQIDIQNQLIEAADTEEERIQRQKELNDLIKQEYELRVSINDFQMSLLERQANRVNPDSPLYEDLINEQIKESQNNADLALEQIDRVREKLVKQYMSEKNPDGSFKYNIDEVRELVENSEEMQALYQTYLDNIDKATELVLEYASARLDRIDARINELEQTKPKEWTSIEQIIEYSDKNLDLLRGKIPILQEALSHSAEMTNEQIQSYVDQLNDVYAAIKEAEIQKQQDIIAYHDNVYDALTWQIQEYIDQIEKQKQVVEDYYDDEIDKINKVNDAKERTIELEKLQDEILNARKDKQRVNLNMPSIKIAV